MIWLNQKVNIIYLKKNMRAINNCLWDKLITQVLIKVNSWLVCW